MFFLLILSYLNAVQYIPNTQVISDITNSVLDLRGEIAGKESVGRVNDSMIAGPR